jgi:hypothetical protein
VSAARFDCPLPDNLDWVIVERPKAIFTFGHFSQSSGLSALLRSQRRHWVGAGRSTRRDNPRDRWVEIFMSRWKDVQQRIGLGLMQDYFLEESERGLTNSRALFPLV